MNDRWTNSSLPGDFWKPATDLRQCRLMTKRNWILFFHFFFCSPWFQRRPPSPSLPSSGSRRPPRPLAKARFDLASSLNIPFVSRMNPMDRRKPRRYWAVHIFPFTSAGLIGRRAASPIRNAIANHAPPLHPHPTKRGNPPPPPLRTVAPGLQTCERRIANPPTPLFFLAFPTASLVLLSGSFLGYLPAFKNSLCRCLSHRPPTSDCLAPGVCCSLVKAAASWRWVFFFLPSIKKKGKALLHPEGRFIWFTA